MKFCVSCGHKLKPEQSNCPECGTSQAVIMSEEEQNEANDNL